MLVARNSCSASIARASMWGQVAGPNENSRSALPRNSSSCPSAAPDQETRFAASIIAPSFKLLRKLHRRQRLAALVQYDGDGVGRRIRQESALVRQFGNLGRPLDALQISIGQLRLGRAADFPARDDVDQHLVKRLARKPPWRQTHRRTPTSARGCRRFVPRGGTDARSRHPHRSTPNRRPAGPRCERSCRTVA